MLFFLKHLLFYNEIFFLKYFFVKYVFYFCYNTTVIKCVRAHIPSGFSIHENLSILISLILFLSYIFTEDISTSLIIIKSINIQGSNSKNSR